jgi:hypothetical protein
MAKQTTEQARDGLSDQELAGEQAAELPDREAMSLLDVTADIDLALNLAAPVNAAVAANANAALPIDASVSANALSPDSISAASTDQGVVLQQSLVGQATATATQDADIEQGSP